MDKVLHSSNLLVSLAALSVAVAPLGAAQAVITGALSLREVARKVTPALKPLAQSLAEDLRAGMANPDVTDDQRLLIPQMIEAALPAPADIIGKALNAETLAETLCSRLTDLEHRAPANLALFRRLLTPALTRLMSDPTFATTLVPEFMRAVLGQLEEILTTLTALTAKYGSVVRAIDHIENLRARDLEMLALRFGLDPESDAGAEELIEMLRHKAQDVRKLEKEVETLRARYPQLANVLAEARANLDQGDTKGVREMLRDARKVLHDALLRGALEQDAEFLELEAATLLIENRVDEAYEVLSRAADSFAGVDPLEPARRRVWFEDRDGYEDRLYQHGFRHGGRGIELAEKMVRDALALFSRADEPRLWAHAQNSLGISLQEQGGRADGPQRAALLQQSVAAYAAARDAYALLDDLMSWATTQNNLGNALSMLGEMTVWPIGAVHLNQAVAAYETALGAFRLLRRPVDVANTQSNLGNALSVLGRHIAGEQGQALLRQAIAVYDLALKVRNREDRPQDWATTQECMAFNQVCIANHDTCTDPVPPLRKALEHVTAALQVYDPQHMPYDHQKATALRDRLLKRLG